MSTFMSDFLWSLFVRLLLKSIWCPFDFIQSHLDNENHMFYNFVDILLVITVRCVISIDLNKQNYPVRTHSRFQYILYLRCANAAQHSTAQAMDCYPLGHVIVQWKWRLANGWCAWTRLKWTFPIYHHNYKRSSDDCANCIKYLM